MRNISNVINSIREDVPESETDLLERLDWIIADAACRAPELMSISWNYLGSALHKFISEPSEEWHFQVISEFSTQTVDEIKALYKAPSQ